MLNFCLLYVVCFMLCDICCLLFVKCQMGLSVFVAIETPRLLVVKHYVI